MSSIKGMILVNRAMLIVLLMRATDSVPTTVLLYVYFLITCLGVLAHIFEGD